VVIGNGERRHADVLCVNRGRSHSKNPPIVAGFRSSMSYVGSACESRIGNAECRNAELGRRWCPRQR
jgi:hypothetical protein